MDFQFEKQVVRDYYAEIDRAECADIALVMQRYCAQDYLWRGFHPFNEQTSTQAVAEGFWQPLRASLTRMQRRMDIFFAGQNEMDGFQSTWVISMGHLMGLFDQAWLGIAPTGKMTFLRYCEFNRVEQGKIVETAMYFDIPHLMIQAGVNPFPPQTAAHLVQPGPMSHDGLLYDDQPEAQGTGDFWFVVQGRIVQTQLGERIAERLVVVCIDRKEPGEHARLNLFETRQLSIAGLGIEGDRIANRCAIDFFDARDHKTHLAR